MPPTTNKTTQKSSANKLLQNFGIPRTIDRAVLVSDLTVGLLNNSITHGGVVNLMKKLHQREGFSFVVPKKYLRFIKCEYNSAEIDYTLDGHAHYDKSIRLWSNF